MENLPTYSIDIQAMVVSGIGALLAAALWVKLAKPRLTRNHFRVVMGSVGAMLAAVTTAGSMLGAFSGYPWFIQYIAAFLFGMLPVFGLALWLENRKFWAWNVYIVSGVTSAAFVLILFDQAQMSAKQVDSGAYVDAAEKTAKLSETFAITLLKDQGAARDQMSAREKALSAAQSEVRDAQEAMTAGADPALAKELTTVEMLIGLPDHDTAAPLDAVTRGLLVAAQTKAQVRADGLMGENTREALRRERLTIISRASSATQRAEQRLDAARKMEATAKAEVARAQGRLAELRAQASEVTAGALGARAEVTQTPLTSSLWRAFDRLTQALLSPFVWLLSLVGVVVKPNLEGVLVAVSLFLGFLFDGLGRLLAGDEKTGRRFDWKWPGLRPGLRQAFGLFVDGEVKALPAPEGSQRADRIDTPKEEEAKKKKANPAKGPAVDPGSLRTITTTAISPALYAALFGGEGRSPNTLIDFPKGTAKRKGKGRWGKRSRDSPVAA